MTQAQTFLTLVDNHHLLPTERSIVDDLFTMWGRRKKLSFPQLQLLESFLARVNVRKDKKPVCPECGGKLINHVGRVRDGVYKGSMICENTREFELINGSFYRSKCEYTEVGK